MPKPIIEVHFRDTLRDLVLQEIALHGPACDLNHLDVSEMQDISDTFKGTPFVGDVSQWNIVGIRDLRGLFANTPFSGDLSQWAINPRVHNDGMLPATFMGTLPLLLAEPPEERTAVYITMFDGADKYERYLAKNPFGRLHTAFILDMLDEPSWLTPEQLKHMHNIRDLGLGLGLQREALCTLMEGEFYNPGKGMCMESFNVDFDQ